MKTAVIPGLCLALCSSLACAAPAADAKAAAPVAVEPMAVGNLVQLTLGMVVVLVILAGLAWLLRRSGRFTMGMGGALRVLGGVSMGARERIVLLQVGKQQLLVGVAPGRIQTLHVLEEPITETDLSGTAGKAGFSQVLDMALGRGKGQ